MKSVFTEKDFIPTETELALVLGDSFSYWLQLVEFTKSNYSDSILEWNYSSAKFGWSFRVKDSKRVIIYLLPRNGFFKVAFVFGRKAIDSVNNSSISSFIIEELNHAKPQAEGKGIRIDIRNSCLINDIKQLILIKLSN